MEKFGILHTHRKIPINRGFAKFIRLTHLENPVNNLLPDDTLTICCRVEETESETEGHCNCHIEKPETRQSRRKLAQNLAALLDDKFTDFVFKVENEKIAAHRAILAARSPVFAAMFQHDMKENKTNEAEIEDVTPAAFKALLQFIYTGHCEVEMLAEELLVAANHINSLFINKNAEAVMEKPSWIRLPVTLITELYSKLVERVKNSGLF
jgi:speckle-type POZ protein